MEEQRAFSAGCSVGLCIGDRLGEGKRQGQETAQELKGLGFVLWPTASSIDKLEEMTPTTF